MLIRKITTGYVIQVFDDEKREFVSQEFVAVDQVEFEDMDGSPVERFDEYLPFDMVQPKKEDEDEQ